MSFRDKVQNDRLTVFLRTDHFADTHTWNGKPFVAVADDAEALKRKNNNVNDISWDNNTVDVMLFVRKEDWPGHPPVPNEHGYLDSRNMKILQVQDDIGVYGIVFSTQSPMALEE